MKTLLTAIILSLALVGCGESYYNAQIFPGKEAAMVALCEPNGGFVRGWTMPNDKYFYRSAKVQSYRTVYHVECRNGAVIEQTSERPGE